MASRSFLSVVAQSEIFATKTCPTETGLVGWGGRRNLRISIERLLGRNPELQGSTVSEYPYKGRLVAGAYEFNAATHGAQRFICFKASSASRDQAPLLPALVCSCSALARRCWRGTAKDADGSRRFSRVTTLGRGSKTGHVSSSHPMLRR